jgi:mono/diheme cytochrome c family protein
MKRWVWGICLASILVACGEAVQSPQTGTPDESIAVIEPAFGSQLERGTALYDANCAGCHGKNGEGLGPFPPLNSTQHAYKHPDWELIALIRDGQNSMPKFRDKLTEEEMIDIIARVKAWWGPGELSEQRQLCLLVPEPTPMQ